MEDYFIPVYNKKLRCIVFVTKLFENKFRKLNEDPYLLHLIRVASSYDIFLPDENGDNGSEEFAEKFYLTALLHDAIEDVNYDGLQETISKEFGEDVLGYVLECSDSVLMKGQEKADWRERKVKHISKVSGMSDIAAYVTFFDKLDNLYDLVRNLKEGWEKMFKGGKEGTIWYFEEMFKALDKRLDDLRISDSKKYYKDYLKMLKE